MICAIYERRPRTTRSVSDPRAAKPVGVVEFDDQGRHHENISVIKARLAADGHKLASTPNKASHPEYDFVVYIEPQPATSPREAHLASAKGKKKRKPVTIGGASGTSRRLPLPSNRRRRG